MPLLGKMLGGGGGRLAGPAEGPPPVPGAARGPHCRHSAFRGKGIGFVGPKEMRRMGLESGGGRGVGVGGRDESSLPPFYIMCVSVLAGTIGRKQHVRVRRESLVITDSLTPGGAARSYIRARDMPTGLHTFIN